MTLKEIEVLESTLKVKGVWEAFVKNLKVYHNTTNIYKVLLKGGEISIVSYALKWDETPEGFAYWSNLNDELNEVIFRR